MSCCNYALTMWQMSKVSKHHHCDNSSTLRTPEVVRRSGTSQGQQNPADCCGRAQALRNQHGTRCCTACWAPFYRARGDIEAVHSMQRLHLTGKGESVSSISQVDIVRDYRVVPARNLGVAPGPMTCIAPAADREQTSR